MVWSYETSFKYPNKSYFQITIKSPTKKSEKSHEICEKYPSALPQSRWWPDGCWRLRARNFQLVRSLGSQTKNRISSIKNIGWYDRISNILGNHTNRISSIKKKYFTIFQAGFIGCSPYFKLVSNRIFFGNWIYHRQFMKQLGCVFFMWLILPHWRQFYEETSWYTVNL